MNTTIGISPMNLIRNLEKQFPGIYDQINEKIEENKRKLVTCEYVNPKCYQVFANQALLGRVEPDYVFGMIASRLTATYVWKRAKIVYEVDERLAEELWDQAGNAPGTEAIPVDFLTRFPFDCIYVRSPFLAKAYQLSERDESKVDGFFAWIERYPNSNVQFLKFETCPISMKYSFSLHMVLKKGTIAECLADDNSGDTYYMRDGKPADRAPELRDFPYLGLFIQLLLYIISAYNDQSERRKKQPKREAKRNSKSADDITTIDVGTVVGAKLRKADKERKQSTTQDRASQTSGKRKAPHMRRAHWHLYWVGSKEDRHQELRWIHPVLVNAEDEMPTKVILVE